MSNAGRKPEEEDGSAAAGRGTVGSQSEGASGALQTSQDGAAGEPAIDQRIQGHLGRKLKESYEELVRQPVPDKFHQLLEELERQEKKQ